MIFPDALGQSATTSILSLAGGLQTRRGFYYYVDSTIGVDGNSGLTPDQAFNTIQYAVDRVASFAPVGSVIQVAPGQYDETVTIARTISNLTIVGMGGRGATYIDPTTEDAAGMVVNADDVTLINLGIAGEDTTSAASLTVTGSRFRAYGCKIEGGLYQIVIGPGSIASQDADTTGNAGDALFDDCEICWGTNGFRLMGSDYGACTQTYIRNCRFHDLTASSLEEGNTGGSAGVQFAGLDVRNCVFELDEAGAAPTKWISLNDDNANSGIITGCQMPSAINSGKNLMSTKCLYVGNFIPAGLSGAQPS